MTSPCHPLSGGLKVDRVTSALWASCVAASALQPPGNPNTSDKNWGIHSLQETTATLRHGKKSESPKDETTSSKTPFVQQTMLDEGKA